MTVAGKESPLGFALLGLLMQGPQSGYDLRKVFVSTPMGIFSDSPGAIYPALRRLEQRGFITSGPASRAGRRRRAFTPTAEGRTAFTKWATHVPTRDDVAREWDVVMLRLALSTGILKPAGLAALLARIDEELKGFLADLEAYRDGPGADMPLPAQLAFDSGLAAVRARTRWVREARQRLTERRTR
jgi:DNA-binding PadR family transcriptional regulator